MWLFRATSSRIILYHELHARTDVRQMRVGTKTYVVEHLFNWRAFSRRFLRPQNCTEKGMKHQAVVEYLVEYATSRTTRPKNYNFTPDKSPCKRLLWLRFIRLLNAIINYRIKRKLDNEVCTAYIPYTRVQSFSVFVFVRLQRPKSFKFFYCSRTTCWTSWNLGLFSEKLTFDLESSLEKYTLPPYVRIIHNIVILVSVTYLFELRTTPRT